MRILSFYKKLVCFAEVPTKIWKLQKKRYTLHIFLYFLRMTIAKRAIFAEQQLYTFFKNTGVQKAIIGVSGGVDSALTLAIAAKALGAENILGVCMPYKLGSVSSSANLEDAQNLCAQLKIEYQTIFLDTFAKPYEEMFSGMAFGNTLARIRMTILFGLANQQNGIVLGTCNKTEIMLGYETKFGDGAADVSVIAPLYKTEVWEWAKHYQLPEIFITKAPSAELYEGHTDEGEMGFSYVQADEILRTLEQGEWVQSPVAEKIKRMIAASEHKRNPIPSLIF